uniref:Uncharacterized protein n=1 Tax=Anguilla anguilla TaxID=7936 RepID=A0A0E9UP85_ANGAN
MCCHYNRQRKNTFRSYYLYISVLHYLQHLQGYAKSILE